MRTALRAARTASWGSLKASAHTPGLEPAGVKAAESQVWETHPRLDSEALLQFGPYFQALPHAFLLPTKLANLMASTSPPSSTRLVSPLPSPGQLLLFFKPSAPGTCPSYQLASPPLSPGTPRHLLLDAPPWGHQPLDSGSEHFADFFHTPNLGPAVLALGDPALLPFCAPDTQTRPQMVSTSFPQTHPLHPAPPPPLLPFPL